MKKRDIQVLADLLKEHKDEDKGKSAILLLGAGASVSAGIPATPKIIEHIKAEPKYQSRIKDIEDETYADYMGALTQAHRKGIFKKYNEDAKINAAHLYAAQIFNAGFVDCVITTNFDNLFLRAHNLFSHIPPPTYDLSIMREVVTDDIDLPGVIYLHGQTHGMWQLNDERELDKVSPTITRIINKLSTNHTWIIVGYSGNDPIFDKLKAINSFSDELYWVGYKDNEPEQKVKDFLESSHGCYYIDGYDADSFFNELRLRLGETEQSFIHKPFTHLKNLYNEVLPIDKDGQTIDLCQSAKKWMDELIPVYEEGIKPEQINTKEIKDDILLEKIKNILNNKAYERLVEVEGDIKARDNEEAKKFLSWSYNNYAIDLKDINRDYKKAKEYYQKALEINPQNAEAHNNYAALLIDHFNDREGAKEHYQKALEINPQHADAHYNYALLLENHFDDNNGAKEHYQKAIEINPQYANAHNNYAILLKNHFNDYEGAKEHYQKVIEINPQDAEAHYNYAILLKENFDDVETAKQHYLKAVEINPSQKTPERDAFFEVDT